MPRNYQKSREILPKIPRALPRTQGKIAREIPLKSHKNAKSQHKIPQAKREIPRIEGILEQINEPTYILEDAKLRQNLEILREVSRASGAKILLALKGFAFWRRFKLIAKYLDGVTASGLFEARLGREEFRKWRKNAEIAVFSPAFKEREVRKLAKFANHIIFNSFGQFARFEPLLRDSSVEIGLRVNPLYSEVSPAIYNPCIEGSRLGITPDAFKDALKTHSLKRVSGIHFHTHCEQNSDALQRTLEHFERHFGAYLGHFKWVNFGGGHHITRKDYDRDLLVKIIRDFRRKHGNIRVYLEPGEAVGWQCGVLVGSVVDIVRNTYNIAITDISAATHMPDCLEMPYTPQIRGAKIVDLRAIPHDSVTFKRTYRLGSPSCLAGDIIGDYEFEKPLKIGDKIIIEDMLHYTIVKNNTFNGIPLPNLAVLKENGRLKITKRFSYKHYKHRNS